MRKRFVQLHLTDNRTQGRHDHVADGFGVVFNAINRLDRVGHLDEGDGIDHDDRVVAGDDFLFLHIKDDVLGRYLVGHGIKIGDDEAQTGHQGYTVFTQTLHDPFFALRNNAHALGDGDDDEEQEYD